MSMIITCKKIILFVLLAFLLQQTYCFIRKVPLRKFQSLFAIIVKNLLIRYIVHS